MASKSSQTCFPPPNAFPLSFLFLSSIFFLLLPPYVESLSFEISPFDPNTTNMYYEGDAGPFNGEINLNDVVYMYRTGRATYVEHVRIWDPATQKLTDFTTHFSFIIDTLNRAVPNYGHGLVFFIAPIDNEVPINSVGGFLGLFNTTSLLSPSQNHIIGVEFDSFVNPEWDPPVEHVTIIVDSLAYTNYTTWNASQHNSDVANAWISYNSSTKKLNVLLTYSNSDARYDVSYDVDLRKVLPEWVKIGFSATTGVNAEINRILSWEFSSTLEGKEKSGVTVTGNKNKLLKMKLVTGLVVPLGVVLVAMVVVWMILRCRRISSEGIHFTSLTSGLERGAWPRKFSYGELVLATSNFSDEKKLGQGGFGIVYKGYLSNLDLMVAVKKISRGSKQGKREYVTEVKTIGQLRHRNLVQLIGWCHDHGEFLLVYEFMPNGSLDSHLFSKKRSLTWPIRYKIAQGLASALLYLHKEWEQCVVHRDIKPSNVMLDSGFNAKLGDFGLARSMDHELGPQTTALAGTLGYLAPEYISSGRASKESDVYSFGIVALEIACGRKSIEREEEESRIKLVDWVWCLYGEGRILEAADKRLGADFDQKEMDCLMIVGLWCAYPDHNLRPCIKQAIQVLNFETVAPDLPNNMPVAMYMRSHSSAQSKQPSITTSSIALGR